MNNSRNRSGQKGIRKRKKHSLPSFRWGGGFWVCALLFILFACASGPHKDAGIYVPGTYKGIGEGLHGEITVETTFSASRITGIEVIDHSETAGLPDIAMTRIPAEILSLQRIDVDGVSGATYTSDGIKSAIQGTLSQALREKGR